MKTWYDTIRFVLVFVILFMVQRLFNTFVYKTDGVSVLFGICYLTFAIVIHYNIKIIFEKIYYKRETKKYKKMLDKRLQEWEDEHNKNESK